MFKKTIPLLFLSLLMSCLSVWAQQTQMKPEETEVWDPEPKVVTPGTNQSAPSDAIVLFDGKDLSAWESVNKEGSPAEWLVKDGVIVVKPGTGYIKTKQSFGSCQLHIEFRTPAEVKGSSQGRGNSGVFLMGRYEVQVLDSYENRTYSNGQAASVYKQSIPLVNASRPPGEWQMYDIIFRAPEFHENGDLLKAASVTVLHNGVLVQNHFLIKGPTEYIGIPKYEAHDKAPLMLQDHSNPLSFRNIWIREL